MKPRDYQSKVVEETEDELQYFSNAPLVVIPTGGGKTVVAAQLTKNGVSNGERVWFLAHRKELISQASKTFSAFGIPHGRIQAGVDYEDGHAVYVGSIQTLARRLDSSIAPPDRIIIDEAHHSVAGTYLKIFSAYSNARRIGLTATPIRTNGSGLGSVFSQLILGPTTSWLTDNGFLSPAKYYGPPPKFDTRGIPKRMGDYAVQALARVTDTSEITGDAVAHYERLCPGSTMIVFCVNVAHAHHVAEEYRRAGYRAAAVDGKMSDEARSDILGGIGTRYDIVTSCNLISEGLDVPSVGTVQLLRKTDSLVEHLQEIGRGLRVSKGKDFLTVLDHVGNTVQHGYATTERAWTLEGTKKQASAAITLRACPSCYQVHRVARVCPHCDYEYPVKSKALTATKMVDGELVEVSQTKEERIAEVRAATTYAELLAIGRARGYKSPHFWAKKIQKSWGRGYRMPRT